MLFVHTNVQTSEGKFCRVEVHINVMHLDSTDGLLIVRERDRGDFQMSQNV